MIDIYIYTLYDDKISILIYIYIFYPWMCLTLWVITQRHRLHGAGILAYTTGSLVGRAMANIPAPWISGTQV